MSRPEPLVKRANDRAVEPGEASGEPRLDGACWVCGRSCLAHPSRACRGCRAGKPDGWRADPPQAPEPLRPILTDEERRTPTLREIGQKKLEALKAMGTTKLTCECGQECGSPAGLAAHRRHCKGERPAPARPATTTAAIAREGTASVALDGETQSCERPAALEMGGGRGRARADHDSEVLAIVTCVQVVEGLEAGARARVARYLASRFGG